MQEERTITIIEKVEESDTEQKPKGKVAKKSGKRIGFYYIIYKSLKESSKNDVMKCIYIKGLFDFGTCVIKEGSLGDSKDKQGRDIKDRLVWQKNLHELLQGKVRIPRYLGSFEENGNYYLIIERIKGTSLIQVMQKHSKELRDGLIVRNKLGIKFLGYLLKIIDLLETLHQCHVVHRDASSNNFMITRRGDLALIDLELSYSIDQQYPSPPFQLGTFGFMSPQQLVTAPPTTQEDIFALGAIIFQMWTYISPNKIVDSTYDELIKNVYFFIPDRDIANIIIQCLHPEVSQRPSLSKVREVIYDYKTTKNRLRPETKAFLYSRQEILEIVQSSISTYSTPLLAHPEKGWFAESMKDPAPGDKNKINQAWYASFYQGAAGIIYMLSNAKSVGMDINCTSQFVQKGLDLIEHKYISTEVIKPSSLHFGASGIAFSILKGIDSGLIPPDPKYIDWTLKLLDRDSETLDMLMGIAGQGLAIMMYSFVTEDKRLIKRLDSYVDRILTGQQPDGSWISHSTSKKRKAIKGFAIGISGIIYFLLEYAQRFNDKKALAGAERGLHWLMKESKHNKSAIYWKSDSGKELNIWWYQGLSGIALTFIKGYALTSNQEYKRFATGALCNYKENSINNNLSQSSGLSGLGEVYLEAYRIFKESTWLQKADWIVQNILHLKKNHPKYGSYWLADHERVPVSCFMTGNSGILHFLLRFCYPEKINVPMSIDNRFKLNTIPHTIQHTEAI